MFTRISWLSLIVLSHLAVFGASVSPSANGTAVVEAESESGNLVTIEALDDLARKNWETISTVLARSNKVQWRDPWCGTAPNRFYRISQTNFADRIVDRAPNFRLNDHAGKSHELYYFWNDSRVSAFVLIFAANGCAELTNQLPVIRALQQKFASQGVKFWMINSNPADTRTNIAAEATRLALNIPILHDRAQTIARNFRATRAAEVVCIDREGFEIFYRGSFDERTTTTAGTATRNFVDEALTAFLAGDDAGVRATKAAGCDVPVQVESTLSYSADIAPILQAKCVTCHSPGNVAPWSMTNHAIVKSYASLIRDQVSTRKMPPWHPDPEFGNFKNDFSLSIAEERKLMQWVGAGAPRGDGTDPLENVPPPPPKWPVELGEPDMVIRPPLQQVAATGEEPYRYVFVQSGLTNDVWVRAAIVRPSNTRVVHHYLVWEGQNTQQMAAGLASYVPGMQMAPLPQGTGLRFTCDMWLTFNLHYTASGEPETDQPELALWFHKTPPAKTLKTLPLLSEFTIPAGNNEYQVIARMPFALPVPVTIYSMSPHMHYRGLRMRFEIIDPAGKRETLLSVPRYHFNWQTGYQLAQPRRIPAGYRIEVIGAFDNSPQNMANPDPTLNVGWGDQSWEEMFIGYFDYTEG
ncbi:MAG TPA: redoxin domain-containing protein [Verrucomicrobiae bacterium]